MRNISFMLTTRQIRDRSKTVTRRLNWLNLKPGTLLQGCEKCQGLKPGESLVKLAVIEVVSVRREPLRDMATKYAYGMAECVQEGFPEMKPYEFVAMFCEHMNCKSSVTVTRIEFKYL